MSLRERRSLVVEAIDLNRQGGSVNRSYLLPQGNCAAFQSMAMRMRARPLG
jgi:hypothetical protein